MKMFRIISALLAVLMMVGSLVVLPVSAADDEPTTYLGKDGVEHDIIDYVTKKFKTPEEKLATMDVMIEDLHGYKMYADYYSGEIAWTKLATGQTIFTNPYNIASSNGSDNTKKELMSQVIIKYTDNDQEKYFYSYQEAALRQQIKVKSIKNGVRVEYTIGREETRKLVPRMIEKSKLESLILKNIEDSWAYRKVSAFYTLKDPAAEESEKGRNGLFAAFPITKKMAVYVFDPTATESDLNTIEGYIKTWCPLFTYETLDEVHAETEYVGADRAPALFRMAIEYTIDKDGVTYRVPYNGLRFDESEYKLTNVQVLPYLGAGASPNSGYTFIPDGSGAIISFEDIKSSTTLTGKLYGMDFAYHEVSGAHFETMRLPVFGLVENLAQTRTREVEGVIVPEKVNADGTVTPAVMGTVVEEYDYNESRGFVAIIEEGDALADISSIHGGQLHMFHSVTNIVVPRPKDSYNLRDAISVGSNATWTVVSDRKYVGNYKVRVIMLDDPAIAEQNKLEKTYEASYVGMAKAVGDYWESTGRLTRLTEADVKKDVPLYIESFGTLETLEKVMSIPVNVMTPLTTFEDIKTMYNDLSAKGVTNINFRLTGFANGGMYSEIPGKLEWEKSVGGKDGFQDLVDYAKEKDFGVYPDFDFAYTDMNLLFDSLNLKKHAIKTIDDRYTMRRYYSATYQAFEGYGELAISPAYFSFFYDKLNAKYQEFAPVGISISTLGSDLNSDFDEDEPYNREDNKEFTVDTLKQISEDYASVMADGGNAYTLQYVDHLLNVPLDSSRFLKASRSIPFMGMVLHGRVQFAGTPINMAGDIGYDFLKAIENGASLYFTLSYQNTEKLKEDMQFSKYYSVRYDIWLEDMVARYQKLNEVAADLQTKLIIDHDFLIGERIPDADEIEADKLALEAEEAEKKAKEEEEARKAALEEARAKRKAEEAGEVYIPPVKEEISAPTIEVEEDEDEYVYTKYTTDDGRIVKVTYEGGVVFYLNYNYFSVTVEDEGTTYTIPEFGFIRIN